MSGWWERRGAAGGAAGGSDEPRDDACFYSTFESVTCRAEPTEAGGATTRKCQRVRERWRQCAGGPRELVERSVEDVPPGDGALLPFAGPGGGLGGGPGLPFGGGLDSLIGGALSETLGAMAALLGDVERAGRGQPGLGGGGAAPPSLHDFLQRQQERGAAAAERQRGGGGRAPAPRQTWEEVAAAAGQKLEEV